MRSTIVQKGANHRGLFDVESLFNGIVPLMNLRGGKTGGSLPCNAGYRRTAKFGIIASKASVL
jgi:hypothetical protein